MSTEHEGNQGPWTVNTDGPLVRTLQHYSFGQKVRLAWKGKEWGEEQLNKGFAATPKRRGDLSKDGSSRFSKKNPKLLRS